MAVSEQTINGINYVISVYVSYFVIIIGLIGNLADILVFTQLTLFRGNRFALYLTVASIMESSQLIFTSTVRVVTTTFGYDLVGTSTFYCKFRGYIGQFGAIIVSMTICFAAIDQFLSTSHHNRLQQLTTYKLAKRLLIILILLAALYSIPFPIFHEIDSNYGCATYNSAFNYFYTVVHFCIVIGILPIAISLFFSLLAYRNVRRIVRRQIPVLRRRLDRQLTAMVLVRVALFIVTTLPLVTMRTYQINHIVNRDDSYTVAVDQLIRITATTFYNFNYSGSFYLFVITSSRFRGQLKYFFVKKIWEKCLLRILKKNQIVPTNQQQGVERRISVIDIDS